MPQEPAADRRGLVCAVIVENQVHVELRRDVRLDRFQEQAELPRSMPPVTLAWHLAAGDVEGGEQRRRPVADVVVGAPFGLSDLHREQRLRAVERLDLALLVDAEH